MNKPTFPAWVIIFLSVLAVLFLIVVGIGIYFVYNPSIASIPGRLVEKYLDRKIDVISHGIYLRKLQDPDKDKDGLTDVAEAQIYKTDPSKFSSSAEAANGDGEYIYGIYKKAFAVNDESLLAGFRNNLDSFKQSLGVSGSTSTEAQVLGTVSLNDAFNLRASETYDFYVGVPSDVIDIVRAGLDLRQSGDYEKSLSLLQGALLKDPTSAILKYHLALTYHDMKQYDKALAIYESIENDPAVKSPLLYHDLASVNLALGNEDMFVHYMELSIKNFPEDLDQYLSLASYYQDKNQLDKAEEVLNEGLKIEPRYASYYNSLAIIAGLKGDNKAEFNLYEKAVSYDFRYAPGHLNLAILYDQYYKNPKDALVEARIAWELDPIARHLAQVVLLYYENGNNAKAKELETELLKMKGVDGGSYNSLGLMYMDQQNYKQAEFYFRKAIAVEPDLPNPYNNLGITLASTEREDEAFKNFQKAIELNPNYANAYSNLGIVYSDRKQYQDAITAFNKAIQLNPGVPNPYGNLGYVYWILDNKPLAKYNYQKAIEMGSTDPAIAARLKTLEGN